MKRLAALALSLLVAPAALGGARPASRAAAQASRTIAVTIDDLPQNGPEYGLKRMRAMTEKLVRAVAARRVPAIGFVNEAQLYVPGEVDERIALLDAWLSAGIELGNHTFAHRSMLETPLARYEDDVVRGDTVTKALAARHGLPVRYFRYPYLETGPDLESRRAFERFLGERGYTNAPVTIDPNDWMFAPVYSEAKSRGDRATMRRVVEAYLAYTDEALTFSERYAQALFGRAIPQVLLIHANELNAENFDAVMGVYERRGYAFVPLGRALEDEVYREPESYAGKEGMGWLERWALARGAHVDVTAGEPPKWVQDAFEKISATAPQRIPGSRN